MKSISVTLFKSHCLRLLEEVNRTREPVQITKRGKPFALVTPTPVVYDWTPGKCRDTVTFVGDLESPVAPIEDWEVESKWF